MSDTPRTDAESCDCSADANSSYLQMRGFAQTLERELAAMTAERDALQRRIVETVKADPRQLWNVATSEIRDELEAVKKERDALRERVKRLEAALKSLVYFCEEDQLLSTKEYNDAYNAAKSALEDK